MRPFIVKHIFAAVLRIAISLILLDFVFDDLLQGTATKLEICGRIFFKPVETSLVLDVFCAPYFQKNLKVWRD